MTSPIPVTGQVSLAGMPPLIIVQMLSGLQQRNRAGGHARLDVLRLLVEDLRRIQADDVTALAEDPPRGVAREKRRQLGALAWHVRLAVADPEAEKAKGRVGASDVGLRGRLSFIGISQPWLREAVKRWAADELHRHLGSGVSNVMRFLVGSMVRLSQSLHASRGDHGSHPTVLGRCGIESLLHRPAYLASIGTCRPELRVKTCRNVKRVLDRIRALGLTRPGGPAAGLGEDFTLASGDIPADPNGVNPAGTCRRRSCGSCASACRCSNAGPKAARSGAEIAGGVAVMRPPLQLPTAPHAII